MEIVDEYQSESRNEFEEKCVHWATANDQTIIIIWFEKYPR